MQIVVFVLTGAGYIGITYYRFSAKARALAKSKEARAAHAYLYAVDAMTLCSVSLFISSF